MVFNLCSVLSIGTIYDTKRQKLSEVIPLDSPLSMYIEPTRTCNFKCFYCMHSTRGEKGGILDRTGFRLAHMDMELFEKLAGEIVSFPAPVKRVCFDAQKAAIRAEDIAKGIYAHVADLPRKEPKRAAMQVRPTL